MAETAEVGKLVVRLLGDATSYQKMLRDADKSTRKTEKGLKGLVATANRVSASLRKAGASMKAAGRSLAISVTAPLAIIGGASVKAFANFDKAMVESTAIMDVTTQQIDAMRAKALELSTSGKIKQGPAELAEAYFFLASAGMDAQQSIESLSTVAGFATAGAFSMTEATDLLTDAQTAMGLSSKDNAQNLENLNRIADVFVKANQSANTSVLQISQAMTADAGTAARGFGQDLETTVAVLEAYASAGKKGAEAGNLFGRATRLLAKAQRDNGEVFRKHGIKVINESTGGYASLIDIIHDMEVAFEDVTKPQRAMILEQLGFNALAQKSILPLIGLSSEMKIFKKKVDAAGGAVKDVAENQMKSFSAQMTIFKNKVNVAAIELGETLAPMLAEVTKAVIAGIKWWKGLSEQMKKFAIVAALVFAALGPVLIILGTVAIAVGGLATAVGLLFSPITLAVGAVAGLVAGLVFLQAKFGIFDWLVPFFQKVRDIFTGLIESVKLVAGVVGGALLFAFEQVRDTWRGLTSVLSGIGEGIKDVTNFTTEWVDVLREATGLTHDIAKNIEDQHKFDQQNPFLFKPEQQKDTLGEFLSGRHITDTLKSSGLFDDVGERARSLVGRRQPTAMSVLRRFKPIDQPQEARGGDGAGVFDPLGINRGLVILKEYLAEQEKLAATLDATRIAATKAALAQRVLDDAKAKTIKKATEEAETLLEITFRQLKVASGTTAEKLELNELRERGASEGILKDIAGHQQQIRNINDVKAATEEVGRIIEKNLTPQERFNKELAKLEKLKAPTWAKPGTLAGVLDPKDFARAREVLENELAMATKKPEAQMRALGPRDAARFGSAEAERRMIEFRNSLPGGKEAAENTPEAKTEKNTTSMVELLNWIGGNIEALVDKPPVALEDSDVAGGA